MQINIFTQAKAEISKEECIEITSSDTKSETPTYMVKITKGLAHLDYVLTAKDLQDLAQMFNDITGNI